MEAGAFWILEHAMAVLQTVYIMVCSLCRTVVHQVRKHWTIPNSFYSFHSLCSFQHGITTCRLLGLPHWWQSCVQLLVFYDMVCTFTISSTNMLCKTATEWFTKQGGVLETSEFCLLKCARVVFLPVDERQRPKLDECIQRHFSYGRQAESA